MSVWGCGGVGVGGGGWQIGGGRGCTIRCTLSYFLTLSLSLSLSLPLSLSISLSLSLFLQVCSHGELTVRSFGADFLCHLIRSALEQETQEVQCVCGCMCGVWCRCVWVCVGVWCGCVRGTSAFNLFIRIMPPSLPSWYACTHTHTKCSPTGCPVDASLSP